jgi:hypothetical protein
MKEFIEKLVVLAESYDSRGLHKEAADIDEIIKEAAKKTDGEMDGHADYLASAVARFKEHFASFARRIEGPTAKTAMASSNVRKNHVFSCLAAIEDKLEELERHVGTII